MRYLVKFNWEGEERFGVIRNPEWDDEAKSAAEANCVVIDDLVLPEVYQLAESEVEDVEAAIPSFNPDTHRSEYPEGDPHRWQQEQYDAASEQSKALGDKFAAGKLFKVPVGDGYAFYLVTKVNPRTCDVEWRGFSPDRWTDQVLGYGGRFPRERIEPLVARESALDGIFG
jgi:hypothetical protein